MSYDIRLCYDGIPAQVTSHEQGGTYVLGGTPDAVINITYNYSKLFREHLDKDQGIRWLYGKTGLETMDRLARASNALGTERDADYWAATPGNAGYALLILFVWAHSHPTAVWEGD